MFLADEMLVFLIHLNEILKKNVSCICPVFEIVLIKTKKPCNLRIVSTYANQNCNDDLTLPRHNSVTSG